ncbi:MAG: alkaline phosphatase family protein, partial [Anaerolineales bacterium]
MKTVILGFDAFDPLFFESLFEQGKLPNLGRYVQSGGYARLQVSNPPQSEVSWTSIATGLNPGGHGLFDFVHRNPDTYNLHVSLLPTKQGIGGTQFVQPYSARTLFDHAANQGYPTTVMWWPATFPARLDSPVRTLPGLGTPDIHGRLGVGTLMTSAIDAPERIGKTPVFYIKPMSGERFSGQLHGPIRKTRRGEQETTLKLEFSIENEESAELKIGDESVKLTKGKWSPILKLKFKIGWFMEVHTLTRFIWTQSTPEVRLYALPLQLDPLHSPWRYGTPSSFVKDIWKNCGPYLTLGWPQDTIGLEDGCITDTNFLDLCDDIYQVRVCTLHHQLRNFQEGVLAVVFDSLDRIQHMFWRDRPDIIERWY